MRGNSARVSGVHRRSKERRPKEQVRSVQPPEQQLVDEVHADDTTWPADVVQKDATTLLVECQNHVAGLLLHAAGGAAIAGSTSADPGIRSFVIVGTAVERQCYLKRCYPWYHFSSGTASRKILRKTSHEETVVGRGAAVGMGGGEKQGCWVAAEDE